MGLFFLKNIKIARIIFIRLALASAIYLYYIGYVWWCLFSFFPSSFFFLIISNNFNNRLIFYYYYLYLQHANVNAPRKSS